MEHDQNERRSRALAALTDEAGRASRMACCSDLAPAMAKLGQLLWVGGFIVGPDRVSAASPFQFGSDATVGLATVAQVGGQLLNGISALLPLGNRYAAMALVRQLVEVEYLAWAFAEDQPEAALWMRSTRDERQKMWQPRHLRERSNGLFGKADYQSHCERGGHPTPAAVTLLPDHSRQISVDACWLEAAVHGASIWRYLTAAAVKDGYDTPEPEAAKVAASITRWRATDPAWHLELDDIPQE